MKLNLNFHIFLSVKLYCSANIMFLPNTKINLQKIVRSCSGHPEMCKFMKSCNSKAFAIQMLSSYAYRRNKKYLFWDDVYHFKVRYFLIKLHVCVNAILCKCLK